MKKVVYFLAFVLIAVSTLFISNIDSVVYADESLTLSPALFRPDDEDYTLIRQFDYIAKYNDKIFYHATLDDSLTVSVLNLNTKQTDKITLPENSNVSNVQIYEILSTNNYIYILTSGYLLKIDPTDYSILTLLDNCNIDNPDSPLYDKIDIYVGGDYIMLSLATYYDGVTNSTISCYKITNEDTSALPSTTFADYQSTSNSLISITSTNVGFAYLYGNSSYSVYDYSMIEDEDGTVNPITSRLSLTRNIYYEKIKFFTINNKRYLAKKYSTEKTNFSVSPYNFEATGENIQNLNTNLATIETNYSTTLYSKGTINNISNFEVKDDKINFFDVTTLSAQTFSIDLTNSTINYESTIFASSGADKNRFSSMSTLKYINDDLYCYDSEQHRLQIIGESGTTIHKLSNAFSITNILSIDDKTYAFTKPTDYHLCIYVYELTDTDGSEYHISLAENKDITAYDFYNYNNQIYILGSEKNQDNITETYLYRLDSQIVKTENDETKETEEKTEYSFTKITYLSQTFSGSSSLSIYMTGVSENDKLFVFNKSTIYSANIISNIGNDPTTMVPTDIEKSTANKTQTIKSICLDNMGNAYMATSQDSFMIYTLSSTLDYEYKSQYSFNNTDFNISNITLFPITGEFYIYDDTTYAIYTFSDDNIYEGLGAVGDLSVTANALNDSIVSIVKSNDTIIVSKYPFGLGKSTSVSIDKAYILNIYKDKYYGIAYYKDNEIAYGYINKNETTSIDIETETKNYVVLTKTTNIYNLPLISSSKVNGLSKGESISTSYTTLVGIDDKEYIAVSYDNKIGYILKNDLSSSISSSIVPFHQKNANILCGSEAYIYVYETNDSNNSAPTDIKLSNNTRIYVEKYESTSNMTKIHYITSDNTEVTGYIETKYIKMDNDYKNLYIALGLLLGAIVIIGNVIWAYKVISKRNKEEDSL